MRVFLLSLLSAVLWGQPAVLEPKAPAANDPVVFEAGGRTLTRSVFDDLMRNLPANLRQQLGPDSPESRRRFAEQLGDVMSYAAEARRQRVQEKPAARVQLFLQQEGILASLLYQDLLETFKPAEKDIKAWYEANRLEFENASARHILVRFQGSRVPLREGQKDLSPEEAKTRAEALRQRILKGEDFAAVAKAESDDTGSGQNGGDLGTFGRGKMIPEFEEVVFSQPLGEISPPVRTQFGYHLIQVMKRGTQPFEELKADIEKRLTTENADKFMKAVKENSRVFLDEAYFGKPKAAQPAASVPPSKPQP